MKTVKLSTNFPDWPLLRQIPACEGIWNDCRFLINTTVETCDYWVVYEGLTDADQTCCPPEHTIFVCGEPPTIKSYCPAFLAQFSKVITCDRGLEHPGKVITHQAQPWHIGVTQ